MIPLTKTDNTLCCTLLLGPCFLTLDILGLCRVEFKFILTNFFHQTMLLLIKTPKSSIPLIIDKWLQLNLGPFHQRLTLNIFFDLLEFNAYLVLLKFGIPFF